MVAVKSDREEKAWEMFGEAIKENFQVALKMFSPVQPFDPKLY